MRALYSVRQAVKQDGVPLKAMVSLLLLLILFLYQSGATPTPTPPSSLPLPKALTGVLVVFEETRFRCLLHVPTVVMHTRLETARCRTTADPRGGGLSVPRPDEVGSRRHYRPAVPFDEAVRLCDQWLASDPDNTAVRLKRARAQMHLGNHRAAVADLDALDRMLSGPHRHRTGGGGAETHVRVLFYRGCCHAQLNNDEAAIVDFSNALELDPTFKRAAYARAASRNRQDDFAGAIEDYERAFSVDLDGDGDGKRGRFGNVAMLSKGNERTRAVGAASRHGAGVSRPESRAADGQSAPAGQRGEEPWENPPEEQRRNRQYRKAPGALRPPLQTPPLSSVVSASNGAGSHALTAGERKPSQPHSRDVDAGVERQESAKDGGGGGLATADGAAERELVGGMSAVDPASLTGHSSSVCSLSGLSEDEEEKGNEGADGERSTNYYVQRGLQYRRQGELQAAIDMYSRALEIDPGHFKALFNRAFCYDKCGRLALAIRDYEAAAEVDPSNPYTYYNVGISCDRLGDLARAVAAFTAAIEKGQGRHPDFYHNRGFSLRKMGSYPAAVDDYTSAIALNPTHFKSRFNRGFCHDKMGQCDRAIEDYTVALSVDPKSVNALHNRGIVFEKLGKLPEALLDLSRALELDPKSAHTFNARGLVHDRMKRFEAAVADFTEAVQLQPLSASFLHNRGHAYRGMGRLADAVKDFTASIALDPDSAAVYSSRAFAFRKQERYEDAVKDYTTAMEKHTDDRLPEDHPAWVKAWNNRAYCLARLGRFAEAVEDYTAVLSADPTNTHALHNRAISFEKTNNYYACIEDLTQLIAVISRRLNGESSGDDSTWMTEDDNSRGEALSSAYYSRGAAWAKLNHIPEAIEDYTKALAVDLAAVKEHEGAQAAERIKQTHPAWKAIQRLQPQHRRQHT